MIGYDAIWKFQMYGFSIIIKFSLNVIPASS